MVSERREMKCAEEISGRWAWERRSVARNILTAFCVNPT